MVLFFAGWSPGATVDDTVPSDVSLTTKRAVASRPRDHGALHPLQKTCLSSQEPHATSDGEGERDVDHRPWPHGWPLYARWLAPV